MSPEANVIDAINEVDKIIGDKGKFPLPEYHSCITVYIGIQKNLVNPSSMETRPNQHYRTEQRLSQGKWSFIMKCFVKRSLKERRKEHRTKSLKG